MSSELTLADTSPFDAIRRTRADGAESWSARDLCKAVQYETWRNFAAAIDRARISCENSGAAAQDHFADASKMIDLGKGGRREIEDVELSRFAAYLTVMNGDPRKPEIAAAQAYFAVRTREAEARPAVALPDRKALAQMVIEAETARELAEDRALELEQKVAEDAPKVHYVELYVADSDLLKLRTVAAANDVGEEWLRDLLVSKGWIYVETESRWSNSKGCMEIRRRYSAYSHKRQYFRPVEVHEAPRFKGEVMHTLKVTPAGAEAVARLITKERAA